MNRRVLRHRARGVADTIERPIAVATRIESFRVLDGPRREEAWRLYSEAFDELRVVAVQRHVFYRSEFDEIMDDPRVEKLIAVDADGVMRGVSTATNDLTAMPLISPDYFAARWPAAYAAHRVFYIGFVAVHPFAHGTGVFLQLVHEMVDRLSHRGGIVAMDMCTRNADVLRLADAVDRIVRSSVPEARHLRLDAQSYHAFEFPATG